MCFLFQFISIFISVSGNSASQNRLYIIWVRNSYSKVHHNTESCTLGSVATLSRYGRQLHPPLKCSTVTFWASKVWPTVRPWTVFGAFHSFTVMMPIASVMTVSSIRRHFLPCCSCDTSSQNYHAHNVIIAFAHKHGNMYNQWRMQDFRKGGKGGRV